jgi:hypothetical protein
MYSSPSKGEHLHHQCYPQHIRMVHNSRVSLQFTAVLKPFLYTCTRPKGTLLSVRMTTFSTGQPMTRTCSIGLDKTNVSSFHDSRASDCRLCYVGKRNGSGTSEASHTYRDELVGSSMTMFGTVVYEQGPGACLYLEFVQTGFRHRIRWHE